MTEPVITRESMDYAEKKHASLLGMSPNNEMNVAFIVNSCGRRAGLKSSDLPGSITQNHNVKILPTTHHGHARLLATELVDEDFDAIVAVGGDGTINQIVDAMVSSGRESSALPRLVIWPAGSGNDFAKTHPCPQNPEQIAELIDQGSSKRVDVGKITYGDSAVSHFLNIAEIGLGTTVIERVKKLQSWFGNRLAYPLAILRTVASCPEFEAKVEGDDFSFQGRFSTIAVANAKFYGSGLGVAPEAKIDDGLLDVVLIRAFSPVDFIKYFRRLRRCESIPDSRVQSFQTTRLAAEGKATVSLDGELGQRLPVQVDVLASRICVAELRK